MSETEVQDRRVVVGIGTRADTHHVAVVTEYGKPLADQKFPTTAVGYQEALDFITGFGEVLQVGMEGTGTYGAAPTKILLGEGMLVIEVNRPDRQKRRLKGIRGSSYRSESRRWSGRMLTRRFRLDAQLG